MCRSRYRSPDTMLAKVSVCCVKRTESIVVSVTVEVTSDEKSTVEVCTAGQEHVEDEEENGNGVTNLQTHVAGCMDDAPKSVVKVVVFGILLVADA